MDSPDKNLDQIFICYRREDSNSIAGRIYDRLVQRFGKDAIFKDIHSIPLGVDVKQHIDSVIKQCSVLLVVIGDRWLEEAVEIGKRRIDDPNDFVRIEIESALQRDIRVIPLIAQGAAIPLEQNLPTTLKNLANRQGLKVSNDPYFHMDMDRLIEELGSSFSVAPNVKEPGSYPNIMGRSIFLELKESDRKLLKWLAIVMAVFICLLILLLIAFMWKAEIRLNNALDRRPRGEFPMTARVRIKCRMMGYVRPAVRASKAVSKHAVEFLHSEHFPTWHALCESVFVRVVAEAHHINSAFKAARIAPGWQLPELQPGSKSNPSANNGLRIEALVV
ncbi:MAG TPA: toll/interleukin-1 receptor domain-containing protein [Blastocatellia bacterium]|jgi:hypothetical protein|nr:toll/interleukin-1 receptor domain-containing protein [Blastocatellia bacterium]